MRKKEADRLRDIADVLDDHCYDIYPKDHKQAYWFHWGAQEIRKVIFDGGFNAFNAFNAEKYSKAEEKWELNKTNK